MLSMNLALKRSRQISFVILLLLCVVWVQAEVSQWLLRRRAEHLLADVRSLNVNRSGWPEAQVVIQKWSRYAVPTGSCTATACTYRVDLLQVLPRMLIGYPDPGVKNWLPRIVDRTGLRSAAARAGFTVEHGVVTSKWFAEQVALPVRTWNLRGGAYVPDLAVSSGEFLGFRVSEAGPPLHPYRQVRNWKGPYGVTVQFLPQEDSSERALLMDFQFACITQFSPCLNEGDILPEAWRNLQEQEHSPGTR
jgi:hypothetical protein